MGNPAVINTHDQQQSWGVGKMIMMMMMMMMVVVAAVVVVVVVVGRALHVDVCMTKLPYAER